jgi:hypothetical protein
MQREFHTKIDIGVPAARAWDVLSDFDSFSEWCPTLREVRGSASLGAKLALRLAKRAGGNDTIGLSAAVRTVDAPRELAWGGGAPGAPWLLDVHHWFEIEPLGPDRCRLHHGERFRGALLGLLWWAVADRVEDGYGAFNSAFKKRCEGGRVSA